MRGTRLSYAEKDKKKHGDPLRMISHKYNILYLARGTEAISYYRYVAY